MSSYLKLGTSLALAAAAPLAALILFSPTSPWADPEHLRTSQCIEH